MSNQVKSPITAVSERFKFYKSAKAHSTFFASCIESVSQYSGDLKTDPKKTGNIQKPDFLKVWFQTLWFSNGWCSVERTNLQLMWKTFLFFFIYLINFKFSYKHQIVYVCTIWSRLIDHLKSRLFGRHLGFYHLKSKLFASLDHFIYKHNFFIHIKWSRLAQMSGFQMAFDNQPTSDHSKVLISDPHCICEKKCFIPSGAVQERVGQGVRPECTWGWHAWKRGGDGTNEGARVQGVGHGQEQVDLLRWVPRRDETGGVWERSG